jgi:hypothetical protein
MRLDNVIFLINKDYLDKDFFGDDLNKIVFNKVLKLKNLFVYIFDSIDLDRLQNGYDDDEFFKLYLTQDYKPLYDFFSNAIENIQSNWNIDVILSWSNCVCLGKLAMEKGIPVIHNERGPLRLPIFKETFYFDFGGVNGCTEAQSRFNNFMLSIDSSKLSTPEELQESLLASSFSYYKFLFASKQKSGAIGVALQVENDSNMLAFSNGYDNYKLIECVNKKYNDKKVIIRQHPLGRNNYSNLGEIDNSVNSLDFLLKVDKIVSINSGTIFEAMLFGIEVEILGDSPMKIDYSKFSTFSKEFINMCFLNFFVKSYLVTRELVFSDDYIKYRLNEKSEVLLQESKPPSFSIITNTNDLMCIRMYKDIMSNYLLGIDALECSTYSNGNRNNRSIHFNIFELKQLIVSSTDKAEFNSVVISWLTPKKISFVVNKVLSSSGEIREFDIAHNGNIINNKHFIFQHTNAYVEISFSKEFKEVELFFEILLLDDGLTQEFNRLHGECANRDGEINRLHGECAVRGGEINRLNGECAVRDGEINRLNGECAVRDGEINRLNGECAVRDGEINRLHSEIHLRNAEIERLNKHIGSIYASLSWKITKPLRIFKNILKRIILFPRSIITFIKQIIKKIIIKLAKKIMGIRFIKRIGKSYLNKHPQLKIKIKRKMVEKGLWHDPYMQASSSQLVNLGDSDMSIEQVRQQYGNDIANIYNILTKKK